MPDPQGNAAAETSAAAETRADPSPRLDILVFAAFFCMGLFVYEVGRNRQAAQLHVQEIEDAEEQLKVLVESSPAAILTTDATGCVLACNQAANLLFLIPEGETLLGRPIGGYIQLRPKDGWEAALSLLKDEKRPFAQRFAVIRLLRFQHGWKPDDSRERVMQGMGVKP